DVGEARRRETRCAHHWLWVTRILREHRADRPKTGWRASHPEAAWFQEGLSPRRRWVAPEPPETPPLPSSRRDVLLSWIRTQLVLQARRRDSAGCRRTR